MTCCLHLVLLPEEAQRSSVEDWAASGGEVAGCSRGNVCFSARLLLSARFEIPNWWAWKWSAAKVSAVLHSPAHCAVIGSDRFINVRLFYLYPQTRWCNFIQRFRLNYVCGWLLGLDESFVLFFFFFAGHLKMFPDRRRTESAKLLVIFLNLKTGTETIN